MARKEVVKEEVYHERYIIDEYGNRVPAGLAGGFYDNSKNYLTGRRGWLPPFPLALLLIALTSALLWWFMKKRSQKQVVLMLGPSGSGKTHIFGKVASHKFIDSVASMKENAVKITFSNKQNPVSLIDIPGHDRVRGTITHRYESQADGVIFVLDGSTFDKYSKDVSGYLYDVLVDDLLYKKPLMIVINRSLGEQQVASVRRDLERQLETIRRSQAKADGKLKLGVDNRDFSFAKDMSNDVVWVTLQDVSEDPDNLTTKARLANVDPGIEKIKQWLAHL